MDRLKLKKELQSFLLEDIGHGDITSQAIFPMDEQGEGVFVAKQTGTIAGLDIIREAYQMLDPSMQITLKCADGDTVTKGQVIAEVQGYVALLLTGERVNKRATYPCTSAITCPFVTVSPSAHFKVICIDGSNI